MLATSHTDVDETPANDAAGMGWADLVSRRDDEVPISATFGAGCVGVMSIAGQQIAAPEPAPCSTTVGD